MARHIVTSQFSGNYLSKDWARKFVLGSLLQRYRSPQSPPVASHGAASSPADGALLKVQRVLSDAWRLPVKLLDVTSEQRILRLLSQYVLCEGSISDEALVEIQQASRMLPYGPKNLADPRQMEELLCALGYLQRGDNLHRISYGGQLRYSPEADSLVKPYMSSKLKRNGGDVYDAIRCHLDGPGYAIDSISTSEVDDAIGVEVDASGQEWITVYVSDATVYCPYDSALEQVTARALSTTTYIPEDVFFMLPKRIVEAATLREDRPCRTFNIHFQVDSAGNVQHYRISIGWLKQLRRLTYDQMQDIVANDSSVQVPAVDQPVWMKDADKQILVRIFNAAKRRYQARMDRSKGLVMLAGGLPDPYVKVINNNEIEVHDQVLSTQEARLAVAEMMIAANEVCSKIAQENSISIPYRGTRALSSNHEAAQHFEEPHGVVKCESLDSSHLYMAEAMQETIRKLNSVTRAMYHHTPLYHAGLLTSNYTHSTSPLRRYPDMLVHHQLKVWLYEQNKHKVSKKVLFMDQFIPEYAMATHCAAISLAQEKAALLQDKSTRFWILRYIEKMAVKKKVFLCLVGETKNVSGCPEYSRELIDFEAAVSAVSPRGNPLPASAGQKPQFLYVSQLFIPDVQITHTLQHSCSSVKVGAVVECSVKNVWATQGVLEMELLSVKSGGDERYYKRILQGLAMSHVDA